MASSDSEEPPESFQCPLTLMLFSGAWWEALWTVAPLKCRTTPDTPGSQTLWSLPTGTHTSEKPLSSGSSGVAMLPRLRRQVRQALGVVRGCVSRQLLPCTGAPLPSKALIPNRSLKSAIEEWRTTGASKWRSLPPPAQLTMVRTRSAGSGPGSSHHNVAQAVSTACTHPHSALVAPSEAGPHSAPPPVPGAASAGAASVPAPLPGASSAPPPTEAAAATAAPPESIHVRQRVGTTGVVIACEEVRGATDSIRWVLHNRHSSRRRVAVRLTWKADNLFVPYNYTFPDGPVEASAAYNESVVIHSTDKILPGMPFAGTGAEWSYKWRAV